MVREAVVKEDYGLEGDAHAGLGSRQVSLLAIEEIEAAEHRHKAGDIDLRPGIFGENLTTENVDLSRLRPGDKILIGDSVILKVRQRGKDCPSPCRIGRQIGACIMPKSGLFASVERGGPIKAYDRIRIQSSAPTFLGLRLGFADFVR